MSLRDEHLKDKHLLKAIQNAPDSDVTPSEFARKAVLDYADKALKTRLETREKTKQSSWFIRVKNWFANWHIPSWQMTGMGSLAASVLVVVMIWHENPDDPLHVATAPEAVQIEAAPTQAAPKLAQEELAKDNVNLAEQSTQAIAESLPAAASVEMAAAKLQEKAKENVLAKTKSTKQEAETASQVATIPAPADKTVLASAPEAASRQAPEKEAESTRAKETVVIDEAVPPAPVAAASAPVSQPATSSAGASADAESEQTMARTTDITASKKMADAEQREAKADLPSAIAAKLAVPIKNSALAVALSKQGGQALASADTLADRLRILYLSNVAMSNEAKSGAVDVTTGYRKEEVIVGDEASLKSIAAEVEAYNQTMREWRFKN